MLENYIKIALRVLWRRKFFTVISLFCISLTLVVLMVVTAISDNFIGSHAPETRLDRMYQISLAQRNHRNGVSNSLLQP